MLSTVVEGKKSNHHCCTCATVGISYDNPHRPNAYGVRPVNSDDRYTRVLRVQLKRITHGRKTIDAARPRRRTAGSNSGEKIRVIRRRARNANPICPNKSQFLCKLQQWSAQRTQSHQPTEILGDFSAIHPVPLGQTVGTARQFTTRDIRDYSGQRAHSSDVSAYVFLSD